MKRISNLILGAFMASVLMFTVAAAYQHRSDVLINSPRNSPALTVKTPSGLTANIIELYRGTTNSFSVPARGLHIQAGTNIVSADGTVTNTFGEEFPRAPFVTITPMSGVPVGSNYFQVTERTTARSIVFGHTNVWFSWVAVMN